MKSFNKVILLGNVCSNPDVKTVGENVKVARFTVATSSGGYKTQSGKDVPEVTQFHHVVAWRNLADVCEKIIGKGDSVMVSGTLEYSEFDAKDGSGKVKMTDIVAEDISLCHKKGDGVAQPQAQPQAWAQPAPMAQPAPQPMYQQAPPQPVWNPQTGQWVFPQ